MADEETTPADEVSGESIVANIVNTVVEPVDHSDEKAWWQSKKFWAFLATQLGFFVLMGAMIYDQEMDKLGENVSFNILSITAGFLAVGYILGQAYIDRYIRVAKITMGRGNGDGNGSPPAPTPEGEK